MKKLIWAALSIFTLEILIIIGCYWLFYGYAGNFSLTISRYVGLSSWSSLAFLVGNLAITTLSIIYMVNSDIKKFFWRFLVGVYAISLLALSLCPHAPDGGQVTSIHRFFAAAMFISLCLLGLISADIAKGKLVRTYCIAFVLYGFHFIIAYVNHLPYLMGNILIWETAFVYGGFAILLLPNRQKS